MNTNLLRGGLHPILLRAPGSVQRALTIECPICRAPMERPCKIEDGASIVHDARESVAFHGKKIWV